jgi:DNA-binding MarR family transcriptional regulator
MPSPTTANTHLPLPTLLSQTLVAFTIECDNEFEHKMPHRTTLSTLPAKTGGGPWLVSLVMFSNFMQFVAEQGIKVGDLQRQARTAKLSLDGMQRWGYVIVAPDPADSRPKPPLRDWIIRPAAKGRQAQQVWRSLFAIIEQRWHARFGKRQIDLLRDSLQALVRQFDLDLPEYLPVLGYGLVTEVPDFQRKSGLTHPTAVATLPLSALLSQVLLIFTLDFERESALSLAIGANVMRILPDQGVSIRDLPRLAGVSKEAIKMSLSFLEKRGYVVVAPDPAAAKTGPVKTKRIRLTARGRAAQADYHQRLGAIEANWQSRFGKEVISNLRNALEPLVGEPKLGEPKLGKPKAELSPLFQGLKPHPDGWRASIPQPETLPHHPMVLHRGGYPDGS